MPLQHAGRTDKATVGEHKLGTDIDRFSKPNCALNDSSQVVALLWGNVDFGKTSDLLFPSNFVYALEPKRADN